MLYVVGTPIGNLQDITLRALEILKSVDVIYCEDTRHSRILLDHFDIKTPTVSLHQHTRPEKIAAIVRELSGSDGAFISDAGTPGISDPGGVLVQACQEAEVKVVPIPGASAVTTLLSVAGVPADSFWFAGFVPTKKGRQTLLKKIAGFIDTAVVYETSPRLVKFLKEYQAIDGGRTLIIGRELTKQFEEIVRGNSTELINKFEQTAPRGELVVVFAPKK
jgi:16S rRNA (cytidine1402-2'-O)-methyltransferase